MGYSVASSISRKGYQVFASLAFHPNFTFPTKPTHLDDVTVFVIEATARFISPPKIDGEDEVFESRALAHAVNNAFAKVLLQRVRHIPTAHALAKITLEQIALLIHAHNTREDAVCNDLADAIRTITLSS